MLRPTLEMERGLRVTKPYLKNNIEGKNLASMSDQDRIGPPSDLFHNHH